MKIMIKDTRRFRIWLLTFSLFAVCFQIFGFFTKAWLLLSDEKGAIDFGLWGVSYCNVLDTSDTSLKCEEESFEEVAKKIARQGNNAEVLADFLTQEVTKARAMATIAGLAAILGLLSSFAICVERFFFKMHLRRLVCCVSWITSAIFLMAAIICPSQLNAFYKLGEKLYPEKQFEVLFPWSIMLSGFGMMFSAASGAMVAILMCFDERPQSDDVDPPAKFASRLTEIMTAHTAK